MTPAPSSASDYTSLTIGQLIGLNLARLYAWCMRLHASGETRAPRDFAQMVISTDAMVHAYVRMLASTQLERAGFTSAASAMRRPMGERQTCRSAQAEGGADNLVCSRVPSVRIERAQGCHVSSHEPNAHIELAQGSDLNSMAELCDRLQTTLENFERAETLANHLARVIVCALVYLEPDVRAPLVFDEAVEPAFPESCHILTLQKPWPPPDRAADICSLAI
ncbi:hypothetical protein [Ponticaulis sp.]|uniref:hypothetical protein n=1 Tax=Ponticaulis sp. TaxID=2020902 RepID=UPI000C38539D|nr:hypothetical protein [Ponticaulis sp.]MAJ10530.1 hypothetical protein [Ponticaulis sp.]HBH90151.1 hypothetical protein [Hyphomonadaceae bacterium]HBJ92917.1 hypothetical protein [Hyphomonadaceae bacterium]|tara:strand:+ start:29719 stop:30384 length:666 start_codon:yes stop_codon:yes gene_type:complete